MTTEESTFTKTSILFHLHRTFLIESLFCFSLPLFSVFFFLSSPLSTLDRSSQPSSLIYRTNATAFLQERMYSRLSGAK